MICTHLRALALAAFAVGCRSAPPVIVEPVSPVASTAMLDAWEASQVPGFAQDEEAVAAALANARRAREIEPDWAPPLRFIDEWEHRPALTLPGVYGEHLAKALGDSATHTYLTARLGGAGADRRMERSIRLDPNLAWAWHGRAWRAFSRGRTVEAIEAGAKALERARDSGEMRHFAWALARYFRAADRTASARDVLEDALEESGSKALRPIERAYIETELSLAELDSENDEDVRRGAARALRILGGSATELTRIELSLRLRALEPTLVAEDEIRYALAGAALDAPTPAARASVDRVLAALESGRAGGAVRTTWRERLAAAFGESPAEALAVVEDWLDALPDWLKNDDGLPRRDELRLLVARLRSAVDATVQLAGPNEVQLGGVGEALLAAGWFREALAFARYARDGRATDAEAAREIEVRALGALAALSAVRALAARIDAREAFLASGAVDASGTGSEERGRVTSLEDLTREVVRIFRAYVPSRLFEHEDDVVANASPRVRYGALGSIVHPGPKFSSEDEDQGRGSAGDDVVGIAELFRDLGRFALLGQGVGQGGPDATVLRLVHVEERRGEHLGRPFRGTVFWCEGADVPGRFGRRGASISGAALHEGYYVDLEMVAREKRQWDAVRERFSGREQAIASALAVRGAKVPTILRTEVTPALGASDRMRLAAMEGNVPGGLREIELGDLAHVTAVHEEGHLCDRARWYPLGLRELGRLLAFAAAHGFRGAKIARALEARAQLVALCAVDDVRLAWVDLLDAAEGASGAGGSGSRGVTPHGRAYRGLLQDLLERLDREWEAGDWRGTELDPGRRWIDQLHRLSDGELRGLAIREAEARF